MLSGGFRVCTTFRHVISHTRLRLKCCYEICMCDHQIYMLPLMWSRAPLWLSHWCRILKKTFKSLIGTHKSSYLLFLSFHRLFMRKVSRHKNLICFPSSTAEENAFTWRLPHIINHLFRSLRLLVSSWLSGSRKPTWTLCTKTNTKTYREILAHFES